MRRGDNADLVATLEQVVPAAQAGEPGAVEQVLRLVYPFVLRGCRARLGAPNSRTDPEDTAQEVLLAIAGAITRYEPGQRPFLAWVAAITSHKATDAFRRHYRDRSTPTQQLPDSLDGADPPESALLRAELAQQLRGLLAQLSEQQQTILVLRIIEGLSAADTARLLGMTAGSVRVAQHRALQRLRHLAASRANGGESTRTGG